MLSQPMRSASRFSPDDGSGQPDSPTSARSVTSSRRRRSVVLMPIRPDISSPHGALLRLRSNLSSTPGTAENSLVIDFSPAFDAPCNTVDETPTFTFEAGTITTHSYHRDCNATISPGPRVNTDFVVTGGTGAFAGATGSGHELSAHAD